MELKYIYDSPITDKDIKRLIFANSGTYGDKQLFYQFKKKFLEKYATHDGYDLQIIKKECYSCDGTGKFKCHWKPTESCWACAGSGVYAIRKYILKRHIINGCVFHIPVDSSIGEINCKGIIKGYVKHEPVNYDVSKRAFIWLLWKFDQNMFWNWFIDYVHSDSKKIKLKCRSKVRSIKWQLAVMFGNKRVPDEGELPF